MLRTFVLAFHHHARGYVGQPDGGIGLVHMLAAGAGGAEGIDFQVGRVDLDRVYFIRFRQYRYGGCRGVYTSL